MKYRLLVFFICLLPQSLIAQSIDPARLQTLAHDPQWFALLHYERLYLARGPQARAYPSPFFLDANGATDPAAELEATVRAFFDTQISGDEHAICRFPARFRWLQKVLPLSVENLPKVSCARFKQWYEAINPQFITLVFPASFLNNPASAFGHTFIRLDQENQNEETRLLAYAADFAARTKGENALIYAFKGIFGGYDGFYSIMPYAKKVEKYSDLENRDIWEYQLNLTREEVDLMTAHLWELRDVPFTYFYFDENCSYHVLALLDVARPSLRLAGGMPTWVIPVDTIRELTIHPDLVRNVIFRPSAATKLRARIKSATSAEQDAALAAVRSKENDSRANANALELAYDFLTYERIRSHNDSEDLKKRAWELLAARSALPVTKTLEVTTPKVRPDEGHETAMWGLGIGKSEDKTFVDFVFRPALHLLTDPQGGYLPGNQIKFFETIARYTEDQGVDLQRFTALNITALTPRDKFFQPISWHVNVAYQRFNREGSDALGLGSLVAGGGASYQLADSLLAFGLVDGAFEYSEQLDRAHAFGVGPRAGVIFNPLEWTSTELSYSHLEYISGDAHQERTGALSQRVTLSKEHILRLDLNHQEAFSNSGWTTILRLERFF